MPTPRPPQEIQGHSGEDVLDNQCRVMNIEGADVTEQFIRGAYEVLKIMRLLDVKEFIAKQESPACGCGKIYDGTFTARIINSDGGLFLSNFLKTKFY